jgi:hypothetical protein
MDGQGWRGGGEEGGVVVGPHGRDADRLRRARRRRRPPLLRVAPLPRVRVRLDGCRGESKHLILSLSAPQYICRVYISVAHPISQLLYHSPIAHPLSLSSAPAAPPSVPRWSPATRTGDSDKRLGQATRTGDSDRRLRQATRTSDSDRRLGQATRTGDSDTRLGQATRTGDSDRRLGHATRTRNSDTRLGHARMSVLRPVAPGLGACFVCFLPFSLLSLLVSPLL